MKLLILTLASLLWLSLGCSTGPCTLEGYYAINVNVKDSVSGAFTASGARLVVRDGAYADSMEVPANRPDLDAFGLHVGFERTGLYSVTVRKPGYQDWMRTNIGVGRRGDCEKLRAVSLTALLQPS